MSEAEAPTRIEGLQIWTPHDSFKEPYNKIGFENGMALLNLLDVKMRPNEELLYVTGVNQAIYEIVTPNEVTQEVALLHTLEPPIMSAIQPNQEVSNVSIREEARLRKLHRGMARTALLSGHYAENANDFDMAANDLYSLFSMLTHKVHPYEELYDTDIRTQNGLFYMFVQAARRWKTISKARAAEIREVMSIAIGDVPPHGRGRVAQPWGSSHGKGFEDRIGFVQPKLIHSSKSSTRKNNPDAGVEDRTRPKVKKKHTKPITKAGVPDDGAEVLISRQGLATAHREHPRIIPPHEGFINRLNVGQMRKEFPLRIAHAHKIYIEEKSRVFDPEKLRRREEIGQLAILGYLLLARGDASGNLPDQIFSSLGGTPRHSAGRTLSTANFLAVKYNQQISNQKKLELPGMDPLAIPSAFNVIRTYVRRRHFKAGREPKHLHQFGDLAQLYLDQAYSLDELPEPSPESAT